ncbi:hypothetical protein GQX73_g8556 [Xylaria multiplex]|uniref:DUF7582 domain-containing protein n=1 Tax=Xylaria multiplex TaxID=323545 RepID=A0A7C8N2K4_9PEZI|nr:hypothetical protein GQX73_g8556 [Xylaria multiplex]
MGLSWSTLQRRRNAKALQELAPRKTPGHERPIPELTRDILLTALANVSNYIAKKGGEMTVIAVGGAVNTIHLESRDATHDVDFYNNRLTTKDFELLVNGAREAVKREKKLEEDWFNNRTILFMPMEQRSTLTDEAFNQDEVIFHQPGLTVLAAPWNYAFCCKVDRLAGSGIQEAREYDLDDATEYLSRYLRLHNVSQIQGTNIQTWFARYSLRWNGQVEAVLGRVNREFRVKWNTNYDIIV